MKKLLQIINRIEKERIHTLDLFEQYSVGNKLLIKEGKYSGKTGTVIKISPNKTSIIVEFEDKTKQRFFLKKRSDRQLISFTKIINRINKTI